MKKHIVFALISLLFASFSSAQKYPKGYFIAPLDPPIVVTGTFGEIRDSHFHSGIDISTDNEEGVPVMAAADGYVSRIKISSDGYGKAIYLTHPNGYVTVYGHLEKFTPPINSYIRNIQYTKKVFEVDLTFGSTEFVVKQRDIIGYSGSSGGATDPHLHFEIRDMKSEEPINPFLFGITSEDTMPPEIKQIRIFPLREQGIVNNTDSAITISTRFDSAMNKMVLNASDYPIVFGNIGFGFQAIDRLDTVNTIGIYSAELYVDSALAFSIKYDRFNFDDTRDVNAHIDYLAYKRDGQLIERCFKLPGDQLNFYNTNQTNGISFFGEDLSHDIRIIVKDFSGNKSEFNFTVICYSSLSESQYMPKSDEALQINNEKGTGIHKSKLDVVIPEGAVFENYYFDDDSQKSSNYLSDVFRIGDEYEALRVPITIGIKPNGEIEERLKPKATIVRLSGYDETFTYKSIGGEWKDKFLTAKSMEFGSFAIVLDTFPPTVEKYYVPADMNTMYGGVVKIIIKDALSGIKSYEGKIDGQWILFDYDKKNDMITANVDSKAVNLEHTIEITVTDKCDNVKEWKSTFYF